LHTTSELYLIVDNFDFLYTVQRILIVKSERIIIIIITK
jgi:hypothetical protein